MSHLPRQWGHTLTAAAYLCLVLVASGCEQGRSCLRQSPPCTPAEAYERNNVALGAFVALVALSVAAIWAAGRTKHIASQSRWSVPALTAVGLTLVAPLVWIGANVAMYYLSVSDPSFDEPAYWLPFVPAILVCIAAIRCGHAGLQQARDPARRPTLALSAGAAELIVALAYLVGLLLAAAGAFFALLSQGGGSFN